MTGKSWQWVELDVGLVRHYGQALPALAFSSPGSSR